MSIDFVDLGLAKSGPFALKGHGSQFHALKTLLPQAYY
jgi:hypothetical protein